MGNASEDDKIEAAFLICDADGNGILDRNELITYLRSTVRTAGGKRLK